MFLKKLMSEVKKGVPLVEPPADLEGEKIVGEMTEEEKMMYSLYEYYKEKAEMTDRKGTYTKYKKKTRLWENIVKFAICDRLKLWGKDDYLVLGNGFKISMGNSHRASLDDIY